MGVVLADMYLRQGVRMEGFFASHERWSQAPVRLSASMNMEQGARLPRAGDLLDYARAARELSKTLPFVGNAGYAMFHLARRILLSDRPGALPHAAVIGALNRECTTTGRVTGAFAGCRGRESRHVLPRTIGHYKRSPRGGQKD